MNGARWDRGKALFERAVSLPEAERDQVLEAAAQGDPELAAFLEDLLRNHRPDSFLQTPSLVRADRASRAAAGHRPPPAGAGDRLGGRYALEEVLGRGGSGFVYAATDELAGERVAVKVLGREADEGVLRHEAAALRLLRLPGVVPLLDDGREGELSFLVMPLVDGRPFPGIDGKQSWPELAPAVVGLLEVLDRIHQSGFVHRDLKPANVLVTPEGGVVLLDLGLACDLPEAGDQARRGLVAGTPAYLSPEQLAGEPATPRSDLYAVGVMLHEALTGLRPQSAETLSGLLQARLTAPPPKAPSDCPERVATALAALLSLEPASRPESAARALELLGHGRSAHSSPRTLPRLGGAGPLRALLRAADAKESLDVVGPPGRGRTRLLRSAVDILTAENRPVAWIDPETPALEELSNLLDPVERATLSGATDAIDALLPGLARFLAEGGVVVADDVERLGPTVRRLLDRARTAGCVLRGRLRGNGLRLRDLGPGDLGPLFAGPDRIHHLREDAAELLWERTQGIPREVDAEIARWLRAGLVRWEGETLVLTREQLDRLRWLPPRPPAVSLPPDAPERRLLALVALACPMASSELVARLAGQDEWLVRSRLEGLEAEGLVRRAGDAFEPAVAVPVADILSADDRQRAHLEVARSLRIGAPERLRRLAAGRAFADIPEEARSVARAQREAGHTTLAFATLIETLAAMRPAPERVLCGPVLDELAIAAVELGSGAVLDRALHEVQRAQPDGPHRRKLEGLLRAARVSLKGDGERALAMTEAIAPFRELDLELARQLVRLVVVRRAGKDRESQVLEEVGVWCSDVDSPRCRRALSSWLGWQRYRAHRFLEAAALHRRAAGEGATEAESMASRLAEASALIEAGDLPAALGIAAETEAAAARVRNAVLEGRAAWLLRSAAYRAGDALTPDVDLVDAIDALDAPWMLALASLTEAAVAWRSGDGGTAARLARRSARAAEAGGTDLPLLGRALALASSDVADQAEVREVAAKALEAAGDRPGIAAQTLGLLASVDPGRQAVRASTVEELAAAVAPEERDRRREVISVMEALELARFRGEPHVQPPSTTTEEPPETAPAAEERRPRGTRRGG